jgi:hypothetical protein
MEKVSSEPLLAIALRSRKRIGVAAGDQLETVPLNALDGLNGLAHCRLQSVQSVSRLQLGPSKTIPFVLEPYAQSERRAGVALTLLAVWFPFSRWRLSLLGGFAALLLRCHQLTARFSLWLHQCSLWQGNCRFCALRSAAVLAVFRGAAQKQKCA